MSLSLPSYNSSTGHLSPLKSDFLNAISGTKAEGHRSYTDYKANVKARKTRSVLLGRVQLWTGASTVPPTCQQTQQRWDQKSLGRTSSPRCEMPPCHSRGSWRLQGQTSSICVHVVCSAEHEGLRFRGQLCSEPLLLSHQLWFCLCLQEGFSTAAFPPAPSPSKSQSARDTILVAVNQG